MNTPIKPLKHDSTTFTPSSAGKSMSCGLKERLKRCGRYHASPISTKKSRTICSEKHAVELKNAVAEPQLIRQNNIESTSVEPQQDTDFVTPKKVYLVNLLSNEKGTSPFLNFTHPLTAKEAYSDVIYSETINFKSANVSQKLCNDKCDDSIELQEITQSTSHQNSSSLKDFGCNRCKSDVNDDEYIVGDGGNTRKERLVDAIKEKEERLRKLQLVKMYREKNDLDKVTRLTDKWRGACQQAIEDLHVAHMDIAVTSIPKMLHDLRIDASLIHYSVEDETFY